ncbi:hypothetical protein CRENBAI_014682 [Crenichthys baileyi]|uniref:Uncharacterized protein n=1 Tax=Crenichthys baileyi TaxID=28760 RepID=A0AAV9RRF5_9TELE
MPNNLPENNPPGLNENSFFLSSIHPCSIPASSVQGCRGAGAYLHQSTGMRWGTPWTGHQSIAGQHRDKQSYAHPFTPKGNLERPITLTVMIFGCRRKPEYSERTHGCTGRTYMKH